MKCAVLAIKKKRCMIKFTKLQYTQGDSYWKINLVSSQSLNWFVKYNKLFYHPQNRKFFALPAATQKLILVWFFLIFRTVSKRAVYMKVWVQVRQGENRNARRQDRQVWSGGGAQAPRTSRTWNWWAPSTPRAWVRAVLRSGCGR